MIRDIANHVLSIGDHVIIISRIHKPFESEGMIIGLKELFNPDTKVIKYRVQVEVLETDSRGTYDVTKSWFSPTNLIKKESDFH